MIALLLRLGFVCAPMLLLVGCAYAGSQPDTSVWHSGGPGRQQAEASVVRVHYLEIVTRSVDDTCEALARAHGVVFGEPVAELGNARTADLQSGGRIGVRAPLRGTEVPVVRPYVLVDDIRAAVEAAESAGATVAIPPTEIPGRGMFSVYILGGIEHGFWQL